MISDRIVGDEPLDNMHGTMSSHHPRQRLKPWLMQKINDGSCPGLEWLDASKSVFKIPWKHFGKPGVDSEVDAKVFRDWAIHTGKYRVGDPQDTSNWKTRFRCALYKLPDIEEQCGLNVLDGDTPYKVYRFLTKDEVASREKEKKGAELQDIGFVLSPANSTYTERDGQSDHGNDSFAAGINDEPPLMIGEDFSIFDYLQENTIDNNKFIQDVMNSTFEPESGLATAETTLKQEESSPAPVSTPLQPSVPPLLTYTSLHVQMFYKGHEVARRHISNPNGLRCAYKPPPPLPEDMAKDENITIVAHIYGPFQAEQFYFPEPEDPSVRQILEHIKRGIVFQADRGDIYATRLCRAKVFYSQSFAGSEQLCELTREHTTKVFDMEEFKARLEGHREGSGPAPSYELFFSIGQKWDISHSLKDNIVYLSIAHTQAKGLIEQALARVGNDILVSNPNAFDQLRDSIESLYIN